MQTSPACRPTRRSMGWRCVLTSRHTSPTHVAALQIAHGAAGLTCATPRELEVMSGVADSLLWAFPPVGARRLARLLAIDDQVKLRVSLDSEDAIDGLAIAARAAGRPVGRARRSGPGMRRVGVATPAEAVRLAVKAAESSPLSFDGIAFYPGHIRSDGPESDASLRRVSDDLARRCWRRSVPSASRLRLSVADQRRRLGEATRSPA